VRTVFCKFDIESACDDVDDEQLLEQLKKICWNWVRTVTKKSIDSLPEAWSEGEHSTLDSSSHRNYVLQVETILVESGKLVKLIFENRDLNRETTWKNTIFIAIMENIIEFSILQEVILPDSHAGLFEQQIAPPRLIREIIGNDQFFCKFNSNQILDSNFFNSFNGEDIFEEVINPNRKHPLIILSKTWKDKRCLIDPNKLANKLAGLAKIVVAGSVNTNKFNESFGEQWVKNGSIRIHWPGITPTQLFDEPNWDYLYTVNNFKSRYDGDNNKLCDHIIDLICNSTISTFKTSRYVQEIRQEHRMEVIEVEKKKQNKSLRVELDKKKRKQKYFQSEVESKQEKIGKLELKIHGLETQLDVANSKIDTVNLQLNKTNKELQELKPLRYLMDDVKGQNPSLIPADFEQAIRDLVPSQEEEEEPDSEEMEFKSIQEAVKQAKQDFGKKVVILDAAIKSSEDTNSDAKPSVVYDFFKFLYNTIGNIEQAEITPKFKTEYGDKYAELESKSVMDRYKGEYNRNGRKFPLKVDKILKHKSIAVIELQPHMKFGSKDNTLRVHFRYLFGNEAVIFVPSSNGWKRTSKKKLRDELLLERPCVVVGWVGDHLPT
jgi:hypothetical protein